MRPNCIVVTAPTLNDDLGFLQRVEYLAIEEFVTQAGIEALDVTVFPGAARFDVGRLRPDCADPVLHRLGDELWTVVRPDMAGYATQDEEVG